LFGSSSANSSSLSSIVNRVILFVKLFYREIGFTFEQQTRMLYQNEKSWQDELDEWRRQRQEQFNESERKWQENFDRFMALIAKISNSRNSDSTIAASTPVAEDSTSDSVKPSPFTEVGVAIQHLPQTTVPPSGDSICQSSPESTYNSSLSSLRLQPIPAPVAEILITGNINIANSDNFNSSSSIILRLSSYSRSMCCRSRCPQHHRRAPIPGVLTSPPRLAPVRPRPPSTALT